MKNSVEEYGEDARLRMTDQAAAYINKAIVDCGGREVFLAGSLNSAGKIETVRVCARGHEGAVPALLEGLKTREVVIHNHPSGDISPSDEDLHLASLFSFQGHGVYIVNNAVSRVYVVVEPFMPHEEYKLRISDLAQQFSPEAALARTIPQFEVRPQQVEMMESVARAFNDEKIVVIEAPTGVGKTLAYLIPAILWSRRNRERVVISTRTINLQEQIMYKDIPLLAGCLDARFAAVLVKGRNNYLCWRKFRRVLSEATLFQDEADQHVLGSIAEWAEQTEDGSLSDLPFVPPRDLWSQICSEADTCRFANCPDPKKCFIGRARRAMAKADLLIVNHHMLFSDLAIKREMGKFSALAVLPSYQRVILDEAHSIEDSATEFFGIEATRNGAVSLIGRLIRSERGHERGLLPFLKTKLMREAGRAGRVETERVLALIDHDLLPALASARESLIAAFDAIRSFAADRCGQVGREIKWRLTEDILADSALRAIHEELVLPAAEEAAACATLCSSLLERIRALSPGEERERESPFLSEVMELDGYRDRLQRLANYMTEGTGEHLKPNTVRWIEIDARNPSIVRIVRCPLEIGETLSEWVYGNLKTIVMTSATLSVRKSFSYLSHRIGLDRLTGKEPETLILPTPFDFEKQAVLCIQTDASEPNDPTFLDETVAMIRDVLAVTKGHALLLFTSFHALDYTYSRLESELRRAGIMPLRQGDSTRTQLLDRFRADASSVLFATDSFWEGVDVAGDALQCVVVPRLPFRVPTEPILEARAEAIDAAGGNSFMEFTVPQAVIRFRQGFGRLIRRKTDRGSIIVLDRRIATKHYGRAFLESLPGIRIVRGPRPRVLSALREFHETGTGNGVQDER